ncbi:MAG: tripartite tricarboxylate transporter TctB family protein, partial [Anaerolineae bacterium]
MASDRILGLVALITAVAYLAAATQIQTNLFSGEFLPKLFPYLIGGVAAICSLVLVFKPDPDPDWPAAKTWGNMALAVVVLAVYAVMLKPLGFILPT